MQEFLSRSKEIGQVIDRVRRMLLRELKNSYPDVDYFDDTDLVESLQDIYCLLYTSSDKVKSPPGRILSYREQDKTGFNDLVWWTVWVEKKR